MVPRVHTRQGDVEIPYRNKFDIGIASSRLSSASAIVAAPSNFERIPLGISLLFFSPWNLPSNVPCVFKPTNGWLE